MKYEAGSCEEYLNLLPDDRRQVIGKLREVILTNLPGGFEECFLDGFLQYVVPHEIYPGGYHVDPKKPLPFMSIASQKNFIAFYHMGIYAFEDISKWFTEEYPKHADTKLDMGKSCIRFKNVNKIPYDLIGELCQKITPDMWIKKYEETIK